MKSKSAEKKVMIFFPWWGIERNIGFYRVKRFQNALEFNNFKIIIVTQGLKNESLEHKWGKQINVKSLILIINNTMEKLTKKIGTPIFHLLWSRLIRSLPIDFCYFWSKSLIKNKELIKLSGDIDLIISSSPPNSIHLSGFSFSRKFKIPHIVDMRDGWLDEPLYRRLKRKGISYWFEKQWERKILTNSTFIFVTSNIWKDYLDSRLPHVHHKIKVITNSYPDVMFPSMVENLERKYDIPKLLYAGKFGGSHYFNRPEILLKILLKYFSVNKSRAEIFLLSDLRITEKLYIKKWLKKFDNIGCKLSIQPQIPRDKMFQEFNKTDGLLLLSLSLGVIPGKLFEYIRSTKPILGITYENSAVWQLGKQIPQLFLYNYEGKDNDYFAIDQFINACKTGNYEFQIPTEYDEVHTSQIFLDSIFTIISEKNAIENR